jgi:hypothetical protein
MDDLKGSAKANEEENKKVIVFSVFNPISRMPQSAIIFL